MTAKVLMGTVKGISADKSTIRISVERFKKHPIYGKFIKSTKYYLAQNEGKQLSIGTNTKIVECKPYSKRKRFKVI